MQTFHLTIKGMHELTGMAHSMIHDMLTMDAVTTNDTQGKLGRPFGMEAIEFHLLGFRLWDTEPMQTTKHAVLTLPSLTGEVSNAISGTSSNCNAENPLNLTVNNPPTQGEMQAIATKLDALIMALRR